MVVDWRVPGDRVVVVGDSGSGKTTLARRLAEARRVPQIELDALHWEPNWTPAALEVFRARVDAASAAPAWASDGNYSQVRDLVWGRADTLIWLDYPLHCIFPRLARRTWTRYWARTELWNGNRETLANWFHKDNLFVWVLRTHWSRQRRYPAAFRDDFPHLAVTRLRHPRETDRWLRAFATIEGVLAP